MTWEYEIVDNPDFAGRQPRLLEASCHDGSPFVTFRCRCGELGHIHESQIQAAPRGSLVVVRCAECEQSGDIRIEDIRQAFWEMRADGWIA